MNDCMRADMRDRLPDLMHGRLDAEERAEVERHVATCAACVAELELLRRARRALTREAPIDIQRIAAAVQRDVTRPAGGRASGHSGGHRMDWRLAMAAALVIAVGLAITTIRRNAPQTVAVTTSVRRTGETRAPATRAGAPRTPAPDVPVPPAAQARSAVPVPAAQAGHAYPQPAVLPDSEPGLMFGGGVSDLADGDVELLLQSVDSLTAVPVADPAPVVRGLDEGGLP